MSRDKRDAAALALDINPVYQNLKLELSRVQVDLAELRQQISEKEAAVATLKSRVNTVPEIAARRSGRRSVFRARAATHAARISARRRRVYRGTAPVIVSTIRSR